MNNFNSNDIDQIPLRDNEINYNMDQSYFNQRDLNDE